MSEPLKISLNASLELPLALNRLDIQDGALLLLTMVEWPSFMTNTFGQQIGEALEAKVREQLGKNVLVVVAKHGTALESIPADALERLGWVRADS